MREGWREEGERAGKWAGGRKESGREEQREGGKGGREERREGREEGWVILLCLLFTYSLEIFSSNM